MTQEQLNTALYKKMFAEQEKYKAWLLSQPLEAVLDHAYEYTSREDILLSLENNDLKVGLDPDSKKQVGRYSLGMRQRLGIAQAIMEQPDILMLDEPMNGLDNGGVAEMRDLFLQLKKEGKTIILFIGQSRSSFSPRDRRAAWGPQGEQGEAACAAVQVESTASATER